VKRRAIFLAALAMTVGSARAVVIPYVTVDNPGNPPDARFAAPGYGAVDYVYQISTYEVTAAQYCEFLNAVAAEDRYGLYQEKMRDCPIGARIDRTGFPGSYTYSVVEEHGDRPINYVSFWDACRFANWLHNGEPGGVQNATTTEDGAYTLCGYLGADGRDIVRNVGARVWVSSEDEWYKAAYYPADRFDDVYFDYPTADVEPPKPEPQPGTDLTHGSANYGSEVGQLTDVGVYLTKPSASPWGTFDQGGNVWEWNDTLQDHSASAFRVCRGGSYGDESDTLHAGTRRALDPTTEQPDLGFRVAAGMASEPQVAGAEFLDSQMLDGTTKEDCVPELADWGEVREDISPNSADVARPHDGNEDDGPPPIFNLLTVSDVAGDYGRGTGVLFLDEPTVSALTENPPDDYWTPISVPKRALSDLTLDGRQYNDDPAYGGGTTIPPTDDRYGGYYPGNSESNVVGDVFPDDQASKISYLMIPEPSISALVAVLLLIAGSVGLRRVAGMHQRGAR